MKNSKTCPKCKSKTIVTIPGGVGAYGAGNNIPLGSTIFSGYAIVTRYICIDCGFSEEWVVGKKNLEALSKKFTFQDIKE